MLCSMRVRVSLDQGNSFVTGKQFSRGTISQNCQGRRQPMSRLLLVAEHANRVCDHGHKKSDYTRGRHNPMLLRSGACRCIVRARYRIPSISRLSAIMGAQRAPVRSRWNIPIWAGFGLTLLALFSYPLFARFPISETSRG